MPLPQLRCDYFERGACRSCALIETPYPQQLSDKERRCRDLLPAVPESAWLPAFSGGDRGFRNRAKLVVGGRAGAVTLGILGPDGAGVDLRECAIQSEGIRSAIPSLARFLDETGLPPYDVPRRRGELKLAHVTEAPGGDLMLRFVVRTEEGLGRIRARTARLRELVPNAAVVSVNLLPEHRAVMEGEREEPLHGASLTMRLGPVSLHLQPQSFFQTNTAVARALYAQVAEWVDAVDPASVWDLYCGVGGFALHCARSAPSGGGSEAEVGADGRRVAHPGASGRREVLGVEISPSAVEAARRSAAEAGVEARFEAGDATAFALAADPASLPQLVIVNPPRRGIGEALAEWLEASGPQHVVYSSCNPATLAKDLAAMPAYAVVSARVFDMFPHTPHLEAAVLLRRG